MCVYIHIHTYIYIYILWPWQPRPRRRARRRFAWARSRPGQPEVRACMYVWIADPFPPWAVPAPYFIEPYLGSAYSSWNIHSASAEVARHRNKYVRVYDRAAFVQLCACSHAQVCVHVCLFVCLSQCMHRSVHVYGCICVCTCAVAHCYLLSCNVMQHNVVQCQWRLCCCSHHVRVLAIWLSGGKINLRRHSRSPDTA